MKFLYLWIDFFTVIIPLIFSFHPKIKFYKTWKEFFIAAVVTGIVFVIWDAYFTRSAVWGFNSKYITGIYFLNLPVEEILFFICIPFSCVFTYYCLNKFYDLAWNKKAENIFCILLSAISLITGIIFLNRLYTSVTLISTALVCIFLQYFLNVNWFGKAISVYAILLVPFLIVNGILTGTGIEKPVVFYNNAENLGIRIFTIPVEDVFYGLELFLLNLTLYLFLVKKRAVDK